MQNFSLFDAEALPAFASVAAAPLPMTEPKESFIEPLEDAAIALKKDDKETTSPGFVRDAFMPVEHTLSSDERWSYPGGNFGARLASNLLDDPRIRRLNPKTLGMLMLLRAHWEAGRPISANNALACREMGLGKVAWINCLDELTGTLPPLIEKRLGSVIPTSFGKPIPIGFSEVRALIALSSLEDSKNEKCVVRALEALPSPECSVPLLSDVEIDLFGLVPSAAMVVTSCPYEEIMALFVSTCTSLPKPFNTKNWPGTRKKRVGDIWKENPTLDFWETFFSVVEESDFLCGRSAGKNWKASFDWVIHQPNMTKIREGNFRGNGKPNMFQGGQFGVGTYGSHDIDSTVSWLQEQ